MRVRWVRLVVGLVAGLALIPGFAQTAGPTGIDAGLLAKANAGDVAAQVQVGDCYASGKGVAQDYVQAAAWYRKAADKGDIGGEIHLASLYRDGSKKFPRDMAQAAAWYRKAAEQGDAGAQGILGVLYSMGQGVPHNDVEAYYWLDLAAAVKGPDQEKFAANRQMIGTHITVDQQEDVQERVAQWKAAHPRPNTTE